MIIGAGLTGILTAFALQEKGIKPIVLEAERIAHGQTGGTTAKITSQHGSIYARLIKEIGTDKAKIYADIHQKAIEQYAALIAARQIDCDFERCDAYLYATNNTPELEKEFTAARSLGLPADLVSPSGLPFKTNGAMRFINQAQFHPLKFIREIASELTVYENSPVKSVEKNTVTLMSGKRVETEHIVFASHFPFVNIPGFYFTRMHQERSYAIAFENAPAMNGMYIDLCREGLSLRDYKGYLIAGGGAHRSGENTQGGSYDVILKKASAMFPGIREAARWSAQDGIPSDGIPYIGRFSKSKPHWYVAAGFMKWGMTSAMVSSDILSDLIIGKRNSASAVFSPARLSAHDIPQMTRDGLKSAKSLVCQVLPAAPKELTDIPVGQGVVAKFQGEKRGIYKDSEGTVYIVTTKCPHLGCQLTWNADEKSWDCPCHGSRFDYRGKWLCEPAQNGIEKGDHIAE